MNYGGDDSLHVTLIGFVLLLFMQLLLYCNRLWWRDTSGMVMQQQQKIPKRAYIEDARF